MHTIRALTAAALLAAALAAAPSTSTSLHGGGRTVGGEAFAAGNGPMGSGWFHEVNFPSLDGTMLHADVLLPGPPDEAPEGGWPMIVSGGPYFAVNKMAIGGAAPNPLATGPAERFADFIEGAEIFANGYGWAQVDTRGYGSSQGCNDYGGHGEQADMAAMVDYFGGVGYSNGNVGLWGKSYDAWTQVMALAMNPVHLKAAVIQAPLIEGYRLAFDNGVHWDAGWYATTSLYMLYDNQPVGADGDAEEHAQSAESTARAPECWASNQAFASAGFDRELPYWTERNLMPRATESAVPTFWTMGFQDVNTKPTNLLDVFGELDGYHKGWFGHWDHVRGNEVNRDDFFSEVMDFLDVQLKGKTTFDLDVNRNQQTRIQSDDGRWYVADDFPASDVRNFELEINAGSYVDRAGYSENADGLWTFTEPFPHDAHFSGEPRYHVQASPQLPMSNLLVRLYVLEDDDRAKLISRGAALLERDGTVGQGTTVTFDGWPSDFVIKRGQRLAVQLTSTDNEHQPNNTGGTVVITSAQVELPFRTMDSAWESTTSMTRPPGDKRFSSLDLADLTRTDFRFPPVTR